MLGRVRYIYERVFLSIATEASKHDFHAYCLGLPFENKYSLKKSSPSLLRSPLFSFTGYSVALGRILKGPRVNFTLVSGAPGLPSAAARLSTLQWRRALAGEVALFPVGARRGHLTPSAPSVLPGEAFGSRFGHALLAIDLNKDG